MRHWRIWLYLIGMIGIFGLCIYTALPAGNRPPGASVEQEADATTEPAAAVAQVTETTAAEATAAEAAVAPTEAPTEEPTEAPTETVAAVTEVDYCVDCHTDKEQLIDTAAPVEEVVEESEGAG